MGVFNLRNAAIALVAGVGLAGCAYGPYGGLGVGVGYGNGYGAYGYDPYYSGYSPYGYGSYGYGSPYWGWNDGFYYPGTGYYVYDSYRRPHVWNSRQCSYWTSRQTSATTKSSNWSGFNRRSTTSGTTYDRQRRQRD